MNLNKETKILIIGLGVIGGGYAKALSEKGYNVRCITKESSDVRYGLEHGMISYGTTDIEPELIAESEIIIFAIYPTAFIEWIKKHQQTLSPGTLITDVTGIKTSVAKDPMFCVVKGTGAILKQLDGVDGEKIDLSKRKRGQSVQKVRR
jgi:prephenate dehydrogenase